MSTTRSPARWTRWAVTSRRCRWPARGRCVGAVTYDGPGAPPPPAWRRSSCWPLAPASPSARSAVAATRPRRWPVHPRRRRPQPRQRRTRPHRRRLGSTRNRRPAQRSCRPPSLAPTPGPRTATRTGPTSTHAATTPTSRTTWCCGGSSARRQAPRCTSGSSSGRASTWPRRNWVALHDDLAACPSASGRFGPLQVSPMAPLEGGWAIELPSGAAPTQVYAAALIGGRVISEIYYTDPSAPAGAESVRQSQFSALTNDAAVRLAEVASLAR